MATKTEKYNGWTNYDTWNVHLWMTNEEHLYRTIQRHRTPFSAGAARRLAEDCFPNGTPDMADRGGRAAYDRVDWDAICDAFAEIRNG